MISKMVKQMRRFYKWFNQNSRITVLVESYIHLFIALFMVSMTIILLLVQLAQWPIILTNIKTSAPPNDLVSLSFYVVPLIGFFSVFGAVGFCGWFLSQFRRDSDIPAFYKQSNEALKEWVAQCEGKLVEENDKASR